MIAAAVVLVPVLLLQKLRGVGPILEFQLTASSVLGASAYKDGVVPVAVGAILHLFVSISSALVFCLAALRFHALSRHFLVSGPVFGAGVFFFMGLVVLPLSAIAPPSPETPLPFAPGLLIHMFGFGLPISILWKILGDNPTRSPWR